MNTNIDHTPAQRSATIIQFPAGGRAGLSTYRADAVDPTMQPNPNVMYGSWYHDEAITQAAAPKKG
jgi:hypothetical protein